VVSEVPEKERVDDTQIVYIIKCVFDMNNQDLMEQVKSKVPAGKEVYKQNNERFKGLIIKSFTSYDETLPLKKQLEALTKTEAEIHAFFGENQIPVEQAVKITK
ncbi:MAG TPA: hypothetical protein P5132_09915, partial [Bacteroidales bacterium]|nr:hypothetical protein [Bacteroidales bacterium]